MAANTYDPNVLDDAVLKRLMQPYDSGGSDGSAWQDPFTTPDLGTLEYPNTTTGSTQETTPAKPDLGTLEYPQATASPSYAPQTFAPSQAASVNTSTSTGGGGALSDAFLSTLMSKIQATPNASLSDPALAAQSDAYAVGQQRARDQARAAMAERSAAEGTGNSGGFDTGVLQLFQQQGENQAGYNAKLVGDELTRQRQEIMTYMNMSGNRLSDTEARALTARLGEIDAELRKAGLNQQADQYNSTQAWNQNVWDYLQNLVPWMASGVNAG